MVLLVEVVIKYFVDSLQAETMLVVAATPVHFGTETLHQLEHTCASIPSVPLLSQK